MRTLFVDAGYWIALLKRSVTLSGSLGPCHFVTTKMVLTEVLNFFAERGRRPRNACADLVKLLRQDANTRIIPQTEAQFDDAFQLFRDRRDKAWSHTDCASFRIMENEGISEALAYDRHFQQAGFKALLRS
jgi:uncharacterized protein